jgi:hypothetical protein
MAHDSSTAEFATDESIRAMLAKEESAMIFDWHRAKK